MSTEPAAAQVDGAVLDALEKRLFQPERLTALLAEMLDASSAANEERRKRLTVLRTEETETKKSLTSLFIMVEKGLTRPDDPTLGDRLATLNLRLSSIGEEIVRLDRQIGAKDARITPEKVARFAEVMRRKLHDAEDAQVRRAYVRGFVGEVVMTRDEITIRGPNRALELAVAGDTPSDDTVRTFMGNWRARRDSNPRPRR